MSYIIEETVTVTLSTLGAGTAYSSALNGMVHSIKATISKAVGASGKITVTGESTQKSILTVANPSTLGGFYYPRQRIHGTTANVLGSSAAPMAMAALANNRVKVKVASSSGLNAQTATVVLTVM